MKKYFRLFYVTTVQIAALVKFSQLLRRIPVIGKLLSVWTDNLMLILYGIEMTSASINVTNLIVGHSTGVVLGGNGIRCTGTLHLSSGVVFGRRYSDGRSEPEHFFDIDGDLTIGSNSVLLGPLKIKGPVIIGALTLVTHDITEPGIYVGIPAKRLDAPVPEHRQ